MKSLHNEELLEQLYWEFDTARAKHENERLAFKGKLRFYAEQYLRDMSSHYKMYRTTPKTDLEREEEREEFIKNLTKETAIEMLSKINPRGRMVILPKNQQEDIISTIKTYDLQPIHEDYGQFNATWERTYLIGSKEYFLTIGTSWEEFNFDEAVVATYEPWK